MKTTYTVHDFGPNDILTSDVEYKRRVKVETVESEETKFSNSTYTALAKLNETNNNILIQLKLLNMRFEETAETHINIEDIEE